MEYKGLGLRSMPPRLWLLAIVSAVFQALPYPIAGPVPVWRSLFAWVCLLPLLLALTASRAEGGALGLREGAALGYAAGVLWYLLNCYWIFETMHLYGGLAEPVAVGILVLFAMYLGLYHALFALLFTALRRSAMGTRGALLLTPFLWVAVELARAHITGFPWDLLGVTQVDNGLLTRLAPYTGAYGLSFVVAAVNALWLVRISVRERRFTHPVLTGAGVWLLLVYLAALRWSQAVTPAQVSANATLLQENLEVGAAASGLPETTDELLNSFSRLSATPAGPLLRGIPELPGTRLLARDPAARAVRSDIIVWPESPAPFESADPVYRDRLGTLARALRAPLLVGSTTMGDARTHEGFFNSALFVSPAGDVQGRYDKMHLVPFGEYTPFRQLFFFAGHLLDEVGSFTPGTSRSVFTADGHRFGSFICYESIFGDEVRRFVLQGAEVLINISNDGWYGDTAAPWQHLNMVRMRAIENRRWVLRATNTGVTAAIDPTGRVRGAAPRHIRTAIQVGFGYEHELTFYTQHGDVFAYFCTFATGAALGYALLRRKGQRELAVETLP